MPDYPIDIIPAKRYRHKTTGRTASTYGACPASGAPGDRTEDWEIVTVGWTTSNNDGTIGFGRQPFATAESCLAFANILRAQVGKPPLTLKA